MSRSPSARPASCAGTVRNHRRHHPAGVVRCVRHLPPGGKSEPDEPHGGRRLRPAFGVGHHGAAGRAAPAADDAVTHQRAGLERVIARVERFDRCHRLTVPFDQHVPRPDRRLGHERLRDDMLDKQPFRLQQLQHRGARDGHDDRATGLGTLHPADQAPQRIDGQGPRPVRRRIRHADQHAIQIDDGGDGFPLERCRDQQVVIDRTAGFAGRAGNCRGRAGRHQVPGSNRRCARDVQRDGPDVGAGRQRPCAGYLERRNFRRDRDKRQAGSAVDSVHGRPRRLFGDRLLKPELDVRFARGIRFARSGRLTRDTELNRLARAVRLGRLPDDVRGLGLSGTGRPEQRRRFHRQAVPHFRRRNRAGRGGAGHRETRLNHEAGVSVGQRHDVRAHLRSELRPVVREVRERRLLQVPAQGETTVRRAWRFRRCGVGNVKGFTRGPRRSTAVERTVHKYARHDEQNQYGEQQLPLVQVTHTGQPQQEPCHRRSRLISLTRPGRRGPAAARGAGRPPA